MQPIPFIQSMYAAFGSGDIATILANCTDDIEWIQHGTLDTPYIGRFQGKEAVQRWFGHLATSDQITAFEPREFFAGTDHVTVLGWEKAKPLPTGREFDAHWIHVFTLRGGKVARYVGMFDSAARLKATS